MDMAAWIEEGNMYYLRGDLAEAERLYRRVATLAKEDLYLAAAYGNLGLVELDRENPDAAEDWFKKSLAINEKIGRKEGVAADYGNLGLVERARWNLDAAAEYHRKALAIEEKIGNREIIAGMCCNLGMVEWTRGNKPEAVRLWTLARDLFAKIGATSRAKMVQTWIDDAEHKAKGEQA